MEIYRNVPPTALGIPTKLLPPHPEAQGATTYPYCAAVQELGLLVLESCPQKKLECIGMRRLERWEAEAGPLRGGPGPVLAPLAYRAFSGQM